MRILEVHGFFLTILTYKIFDFDLKKLKMGKFLKIPEIFSNFLVISEIFLANFGISEKIETFISENLKIFGYDFNFFTWTPPMTISNYLYFLTSMTVCSEFEPLQPL